VTPLYPQKLALTSPTGGGRSVGIVRVRTKATEFYLFRYLLTKLKGNVIILIADPLVRVCPFFLKYLTNVECVISS